MTWRLQYTYCRDVIGYWQIVRLISRCRHPDPGQDLIPLQRLHVFAHSRDPHPAIKLWCQVPFTKSKTTFQIEMCCMQCFLKSKYIKSRTFNDKNRWIIKKVMVFMELLPHLATRGTYSPGGWRCDEAWREQTLVYPPVMCQQRLIYCTWELNVMTPPWWNIEAVRYNFRIIQSLSTLTWFLAAILCMWYIHIDS